MSTLALLLSIVFVAWLLARDIKRRSSVSSAIWIPTVLVLALGSRSPAVWLALGTDNSGVNERISGEGGPLDHVFYLSLAVASLLVASARGVNWKKFFAGNIGVTLFYLYFATSVLWADNPTSSFIRWFKDFSFLSVIGLILSEKDPQEAIRAVFVRSACLLIPLSVVCCRYYPMVSRGYTLDGIPTISGVAANKNGLGESLFVLGMFLLWDYLEKRSRGERKWDCLVLGIMAAWLLITSDSKTAYVCVLIGMALMVRPKRLASSAFINRTLLVGALSLPVLVLLTQEFSSSMAPVLQALGRDATFTGRTAIWDHITATTVNPLVGNGFWNFWGEKPGLAIVRAMDTPIPSAHNGYLDIYLDGGLIGLCLLFYLLFRGGNRLIKEGCEYRYQQFRFAVLIAVIVYNLTESLYARPSVLWFTTLLMLIDLPRREPDVRAAELGGHESNSPQRAYRPDAVTEASSDYGESVGCRS